VADAKHSDDVLSNADPRPSSPLCSKQNGSNSKTNEVRQTVNASGRRPLGRDAYGGNCTNWPSGLRRAPRLSVPGQGKGRQRALSRVGHGRILAHRRREPLAGDRGLDIPRK